MIIETENILQAEQPDTVLVQGDTNSVLAGAIATSKLEPNLAHIEAGLRCHDREMSEEMNRTLTDHAADYLFAPTEQAALSLSGEGIPDERIYVTGNTIVDAVEQHKELASRDNSVLIDLGLESNGYILLTTHRAENVDEPDRFEDILSGVADCASRIDVPVVYPIHPRAENRLQEFNINVPPQIRTIPPQNFLDFLRLELDATLVFTDSGGVQEETCILGTPCVTVRDSTERPETLEVGSNVLAGTARETIVERGLEMQQRTTDWENPFGDGTAAEKIVSIITGQ